MSSSKTHIERDAYTSLNEICHGLALLNGGQNFGTALGSIGEQNVDPLLDMHPTIFAKRYVTVERAHVVRVDRNRVARADPLSARVFGVPERGQFSVQLGVRPCGFLGRVQNTVHHYIRRQRCGRHDNVLATVDGFAPDFRIVDRREGVYA